MTIFRTTNITAANLVSLCAMGASGGFFFLPNIYMQQVLHFSAARAGVAIIPQAITSIVMGRFITLGMGKLSLRNLGDSRAAPHFCWACCAFCGCRRIATTSRACSRP